MGKRSGCGTKNLLPEEAMRGKSVLGAFLLVFILAGTALAESHQYYLPYYTSLGGKWTGVALRNCSTTETANTTVTVYRSSGSVITTHANALNPSGQKAFMAGPGAAAEGWIKVVSDRPLTGLSFIGNGSAPLLMFDITLISELSMLLHIPHVAQSATAPVWDTTIMLCNPNGSQASVTLRYVNENGTVTRTAARTIPALGSGKYLLADILQGDTCTRGTVEVESNVGVAGFALYENTSDPGHVSYAGISAVKPGTDLLHTYSLPRFDTTGGKWTGVALRNASTTTAAAVTLTVFRESGGLPAEVKNINIPPSGQWVDMVGRGITNTGWIRVLSSTPLTGLCFIARTTPPDDLMYDITLISETSTSLYVPHVAQSAAVPVWDTSVMVCNPNLSQATVTCRFYRSDGVALDPVSYTLPAYGSRVCEVSDLTGATNYTSGSVEITGTLGIAAFALYHSLNSPAGEKYYAGISAMPCTEDSGNNSFDGHWAGTAVSVPLTAMCGSATVDMTITDSVISGTATDTWGETYTLSGTVYPTGDIEAAMASGDEENVAQFSGQLSGDSGSGTWEDIEGCSGTWTLTRM
jgi:hypothetical protein